MKTLVKDSQETKLLLHLKTQKRTAASSAPAEKKESTTLKEGFYHPTLKRPQHGGVSGPAKKSEKMEHLVKKKTNTQSSKKTNKK